jgi:single-strand DNA-binding protein
MGRLTRDPELRHTQNGTSVTSFTLAVDRRFVSRGEGGERGERQTDFIDVVAWRQTAEFVTRYFTKGQLCAVSGSLQIRDYTDKEGNKRRSAEVVAENIYFTGDKRERSDGTGYQSGAPSYGGGSPSSGGYSSQTRPPQSEYGGGSYGSSAAPSASSAPSGFSELDDDDGELPF